MDLHHAVQEPEETRTGARDLDLHCDQTVLVVQTNGAEDLRLQAARELLRVEAEDRAQGEARRRIGIDLRRVVI